MTRILAAALFGLAMLAPARAANMTLPPSGSMIAAVYLTCRPVSRIDMAPIGAEAVAECLGIAKNAGASDLFDNLSVKCIERDETRAGDTQYFGWCSQTDKDGDKIFSSYDGADGGKIALIGGTGKYQTMTGGGTWTVTEAPAPDGGAFAFTLKYDVSWRTK